MATSTPSTDEAATCSTVNTLLAAIPHGSLADLLATTVPGGGAQTLSAGILSTQSIESLLSKILLIPGEKAETFHDITVTIDLTAQLAAVWAASKVWIEGVVVSEGTNALTLHKIEVEWKVSSVSDVSVPVEGK